MQKICVKRLEKTENCTRGILLLNGLIECATLELPWRNNETDISCIPEGKYTAKRHVSPKFKECFSVQNVEGRTNILIHAGNTTDDTSGCIIVGSSYGELKNKPAVLDSRKALDKLLSKIDTSEEIELTIE